MTVTDPAPETSSGLFSGDPNVAEPLVVVTLHNVSLGSIGSTLITMLERLMRSVTPASLSGSQGTGEIWLLLGLQVRGKSDVLGRFINWKISENCFIGFSEFGQQVKLRRFLWDR